MHTIKCAVAIAVTGGALILSAAAGIAAPTHQHAGSCGEYMYWHGGKCVDARDRAGKAWAESMTSRPAW